MHISIQFTKVFAKGTGVIKYIDIQLYSYCWQVLSESVTTARNSDLCDKNLFNFGGQQKNCQA